MVRIKLFSMICLLSVVISGCSTIYGRQNDEKPIHFSSAIEGVTVTCGSETIETPGNIELKQSKTHHCKASKDGYRSETVRVISHVNKEGFHYSTKINWDRWGKWTLGIGNLIAWPIDFISGSMRGFNADKIEVELTAEGGSVTKQIIAKTGDIGKAIIGMPKNVVDQTTYAAVDTALRPGAERVGLASQEQRQAAEDTVEGKEVLERMEEKYGDGGGTHV